MNSEITTRMTKGDMKSLFYLMNAKPTSSVKVFTAPMQVGKDDVNNLNLRITTKLKTHSVDVFLTTVRVGYVGARYDEFGTWDGFNDYNWLTSDCVEEIVIKWDFMLNIDGYAAPQRHTLLVRISADFKPSSFIQLITSSNQEEIEDIDITLAPGFCRVDFINAQMSKELINEVSDWFKSCNSPKLIPDFWYWCKKKRKILAEIFDHWFILSMASLEIGLILCISKNYYTTESTNFFS